MKRLGIGIIGCGYWGINFVRVLSELAGSEVVAVCDTRQERLQEVQRRFPGVAVTDDIEDMLGMHSIDATLVCTQATAHYPVARRCLETGRHVFVEKPMTTRVHEAEDLISIAEARGLVLMVGHTFLFNSGVRKVKKLIQDDKVGRLHYLYARRTNLGPIRHDVNALWDLAPHDVSIFNYLLEREPDWVSAVGAKVLLNSREDVGFMSLGYGDHTVGHIHVSWADPNKVREVVVVGSERRIVFDDLNALERVRVYEKGVAPAPPEASSYGEYHFLMRDGDIISPKVEVSEPLKNECSHFLECVEQGTTPISDGEAGLQVVRVMRAIDRSIERKGAPVEVSNGAQWIYQEPVYERAVR